MTRITMSDVHVLPIDDTIEHEESTLCWCRPTVNDEIDERVVVHHSADGREYFEDDHEAHPAGKIQ